MTFLSICLRVLLNLSTSPSVSGWNMEVLSCFTFSYRQVSFITVDMKHEPWSVRISSAIPTKLKSCTSSFATAFEVADRSGIASGKQGGIVEDDQKISVSPARLWQGPHNIKCNPAERGFNYRQKWISICCLGAMMLTHRTVLTIVFNCLLDARPIEPCEDALVGLL